MKRRKGKKEEKESYKGEQELVWWRSASSPFLMTIARGYLAAMMKSERLLLQRVNVSDMPKDEEEKRKEKEEKKEED